MANGLLLEELKYHLKITWDEEDHELERLLKRGIKVLERIFGVEVDYEEHTDAKELLFNWCRYSRNNATEYFHGNFREEINLLSFSLAIEEMKGREENEE